MFPDTIYCDDRAVGVSGRGDQLSDDQLRDAIHVATGKFPHPLAKRATLIGKFNEINSRA